MCLSVTLLDVASPTGWHRSARLFDLSEDQGVVYQQVLHLLIKDCVSVIAMTSFVSRRLIVEDGTCKKGV